MKNYKIGFDIGGVFTTHSELFKDLVEILSASPRVQIYAVTDMPYEAAKSMLEKNEVPIVSENILSCNWTTNESECKEVVCKDNGINILIDDHLPYLSALTGTLGLLVMPLKETL